MIHHRMALVVTLAAAIAACGTEDARTDVPTPRLEDPVAYFGLEPCTCYEYRSLDGDALRLGIAVESISTEVLGGGGAEETVVRFRRGGQQVRQEVYRPTDPDLLLRQITLAGALGETWSSVPPLPWLRFPAASGKVVEANVTMRQPNTEISEEIAFRANYLAETVQASIDGGEQQAFDAFRVSYQNLPFREEPRWFVPDVGLVRVELDISGNRTRWVLANKRTLGGTCPWALGTAPDDLCGIQN